LPDIPAHETAKPGWRCYPTDWTSVPKCIRHSEFEPSDDRRVGVWRDNPNNGGSTAYNSISIARSRNPDESVSL